MSHWASMLIAPQNSIMDALKIIDQGGGQIAIVIDEDHRLMGVITDADVRKAIVRNIPLDESCSTIMTTSPTVAKADTSRAEQLDIMRSRHLRQLPIVDDNGRLVDVALFMDMLTQKHIHPNSVVIMAGGLGTRLGPLTNDTPKPLLMVGDRPLLETILIQLIDQGFRRFFFSVNYKAEMIVDHFGNGENWGVEIQYLHENKRLGTAGALYLLPDGITDDLLVMNGDILTKVDLGHMLTFHGQHGAGLTMAVKDYNLNVPYGVVELDDHSMIKAFREKPNHRFFVNAGIYVLSPSVLRHIPADEYFDMPALFERIRNHGQKLTAFPIREYWMDVGLPKDFKQANDEYEHHFRQE